MKLKRWRIGCWRGGWVPWFLLAATITGDAHAAPARGLALSWTNNVLTLTGPELPGGTLKVWYLEAFCRSGSTKRDWNETVIPHQTELISANRAGTKLRLESLVQPAVKVWHDLSVVKDGVEFRVKLKNQGAQFADVCWFEPCIHVDRFTGLQQSNYITRCFIFTERGLARLDQLPRNEEARYRGGQVYVPTGINLEDVNPRPISPVVPANGLIGCFSQDNRLLFAMAWNQTQHLFQGVIVCIHSDPHVGGLNPGQTKEVRGKLYLTNNDVPKLLREYERDFGGEVKRR